MTFPWDIIILCCWELSFYLFCRRPCLACECRDVRGALEDIKYRDKSTIPYTHIYADINTQDV